MIAAEVLVVALPIVGILLPIALLVASSKVGGSQPPALDTIVPLGPGSLNLGPIAFLNGSLHQGA